MALKPGLFTAAVLLVSSSWALPGSPPPELFSRDTPLRVTLEAPFDDLFSGARRDPDYSVSGTLTYEEEAGGREWRIEHVEIATRGHTSRQQEECDFPKLKVKLDSAGGGAAGPLFDGIRSLKIATHCGD